MSTPPPFIRIDPKTASSQTVLAAPHSENKRMSAAGNKALRDKVEKTLSGKPLEGECPPLTDFRRNPIVKRPEEVAKTVNVAAGLTYTPPTGAVDSDQGSSILGDYTAEKSALFTSSVNSLANHPLLPAH